MQRFFFTVSLHALFLFGQSQCFKFQKKVGLYSFTFWQMRTKFQSDFLSVSYFLTNVWILLLLCPSGQGIIWWFFFSLMNMECVFKFLPKKKIVTILWVFTILYNAYIKLLVYKKKITIISPPMHNIMIHFCLHQWAHALMHSILWLTFSSLR